MGLVQGEKVEPAQESDNARRAAFICMAASVGARALMDCFLVQFRWNRKVRLHFTNSCAKFTESRRIFMKCEPAGRVGKGISRRYRPHLL
jgi:hypothetical protein